MRVAVGADDAAPLVDALIEELRHRGADVECYGVPAGQPAQWASIGRAVGEAVASSEADFGIVCCWTGTGVSIAANKVVGARAALCGDPVTAQGARTWNDANVLALSLRNTSVPLGLEILDAFLRTPPSDVPDDLAEIGKLEGTVRA